MNWGKSIILAFVLFALFIGTLVGIALQQDFYLVSEDYYDQEIRYEEQINKIRNSRKLSGEIGLRVSKEERTALLELPEELKSSVVNGTIHFFRPSDATLDRQIRIIPDENGQQYFDLKDLKNGLWRIKIDLETNDAHFYEEKVLIL